MRRNSRFTTSRRLGLAPVAPPCKRGACERRGAGAGEFACVAPVLLAVVVGLTELTRVYNVQNTLETAAREGARFAALDRTGMMQSGQSANSKLISDVKNF